MSWFRLVMIECGTEKTREDCKSTGRQVNRLTGEVLVVVKRSQEQEEEEEEGRRGRRSRATKNGHGDPGTGWQVPAP